MEFSRQEYWSGLPFPSPGDLPDPGIIPGSPALQADSLPSEPPGKPNFSFLHLFCFLQVFSGLDGAHPHWEGKTNFAKYTESHAQLRTPSYSHPEITFPFGPVKLAITGSVCGHLWATHSLVHLHPSSSLHFVHLCIPLRLPALCLLTLCGPLSLTATSEPASFSDCVHLRCFCPPPPSRAWAGRRDGASVGEDVGGCRAGQTGLREILFRDHFTFWVLIPGNWL